MALSHKEEKILKSIYVASENDPLNPEFPADDPKFPATPTIPIDVSGFDNVWLKDESKNPTGTPKDRMAWDIVVGYRILFFAEQEKRTDRLSTSFNVNNIFRICSSCCPDCIEKIFFT